MKTRKTAKETKKLVETILQLSGMSKEALAAKVGVSLFTILKWKSGKVGAPFTAIYYMKRMVKRLEK